MWFINFYTKKKRKHTSDPKLANYEVTSKKSETPI